MIPRLHSDEFKYFGASELAREVGAASSDHLMMIDNNGIEALSKSNTVATLLPGTTFFLNKKTYANGRKLIDNKCKVAIASDFNPGTCTIRSLSNIMLLAVQNCGLTLDEAFLGVTYNAAKSLNLENHLSQTILLLIHCLQKLFPLSFGSLTLGKSLRVRTFICSFC